ncbi:hypothetical protein [Paraburkholderia sp. BL10I2N1]|uniref:hypothetical protein n=1 Tax=Paraburkholderia sp. BL10I2N1 TaxID=1938796 RepID=UPI00105C18CB|nr:hypothetical protein [Paraburkholderia sp. BL10I2N1]
MKRAILQRDQWPASRCRDGAGFPHFRIRRYLKHKIKAVRVLFAADGDLTFDQHFHPEGGCAQRRSKFLFYKKFSPYRPPKF